MKKASGNFEAEVTTDGKLHQVKVSRLGKWLVTYDGLASFTEALQLANDVLTMGKITEIACLGIRKE
jgi:hypothetical protein